MSLTCGLLMFLAFAQPGQADGQPVPVISIWAVQATVTGEAPKHIDEELNGAKKALEKLPFDHFKALRVVEGGAPYGQEIIVPAGGRYTVYVKPEERRSDGRVKVQMRVEMPARELRGKPVEALKVEFLIVPGELTKVRGFFLEEGELILVLRVDFPKPPTRG